jgi:hypothetical protein
MRMATRSTRPIRPDFAADSWISDAWGMRSEWERRGSLTTRSKLWASRPERFRWLLASEKLWPEVPQLPKASWVAFPWGPVWWQLELTLITASKEAVSRALEPALV